MLTITNKINKSCLNFNLSFRISKQEQHFEKLHRHRHRHRHRHLKKNYDALSVKINEAFFPPAFPFIFIK